VIPEPGVLEDKELVGFQPEFADLLIEVLAYGENSLGAPREGDGWVDWSGLVTTLNSMDTLRWPRS